MPRLHIIGRKNSGKTTLIAELVSCLTERGYRVGTIKHTHHQHELDVPGKDSYRHRRAGAHVVGIQSPNLAAVFFPMPAVADTSDTGTSDTRDEWPEALEAVFADCDLVLVEGHSQTDGLKVEVWRETNRVPPYAAADSTIHALITDDNIACPVPVWPRQDVVALAERIVELTAAQLRETDQS